MKLYASRKLQHTQLHRILIIIIVLSVYCGCNGIKSSDVVGVYSLSITGLQEVLNLKKDGLYEQRTHLTGNDWKTNAGHWKLLRNGVDLSDYALHIDTSSGKLQLPASVGSTVLGIRGDFLVISPDAGVAYQKDR